VLNARLRRFQGVVNFPDEFFHDIFGLDHGIGHSLLLLYDVKAPNGQKSKEFKGLGHYPSSTSLGLF
jgi:hypothetical protein